MMPEEQRAALVDHELCHFTREEWEEPDPKVQSKWVTVYGAATDPDSWGIREHDVEEFSEIIERHGLWDIGIETFAEAVREADHQMTISDVQRKYDHFAILSLFKPHSNAYNMALNLLLSYGPYI